MTKEDKRFALIVGTVLMLAAIGFMIWLPYMSGRRWTAVILLFIVGFGLVVAGSPDSKE